METPKRKRRLLENDKSTPSPKRARKELRLDSKLDLITDSEKIPKISQKDLSLKYGIGKATVCDILKRKDEYRRQSEENIGSKRIWHVSTGKFSDFNHVFEMPRCLPKQKTRMMTFLSMNSSNVYDRVTCLFHMMI